ncbi:hemerythrin domain-containing protein [uncultured Draconibacterium sp.]|uniref:hemerythrin domain-containing protein n=1 Tax=uncultured Draconibacterium sp. TaxID=1573823 RepID=UPI0032164F47
MNTATQNLENDHIYILRLCDVILKMVEKESTETDHFELVVQLIKNFADGLHHAKEEDLLFPLLGDKGFSKEQGPVAVMLHEHVQGRNFVHGVTEGIQAFKSGNSDSIQVIYENLSGYAHLLQAHIDKENNILFRMADDVLNDDEQKYLLSKFSTIEENAKPEFNLTNSIQNINKLAAIYLA